MMLDITDTSGTSLSLFLFSVYRVNMVCSSQVYSTDMFYTVFKQNPMDPKQGRRYRHTVLEKGGSQDEMRTLQEFLGREPRADGFYKELGLS